VIDGLNVITTIEVALAGGVLLLGRDGCIRDMASFHGNYRLVHETERAVAILVDVVESMNPSKVMVYVDRPVSNSGRLAEIIRATAAAKGSGLEAMTSDRGGRHRRQCHPRLLRRLVEPGAHRHRATPRGARSALVVGPVLS
jgi:hypothetical protein